MKRFHFQILVSLMCISLVGISSLQYWWLNTAFETNAERFDRSVHLALKNTVDRLDAIVIENSLMQFSLDSTEEQLFGERVIQKSFSVSDTSDFEEVDVRVRSILDGEHRNETIIRIDSTSNGQNFSETIYMINSNDPASASVDIDALIDHRLNDYSQVIIELVHREMSGDRSKLDRLKGLDLDSTLNRELQGLNIDLIHSTSLDSVKVQDTRYQAELFPRIGGDNKLFLSLHIENRESKILNTMLLPLMLSLALSVLLLITMAFSVYSILKQKRLARMKADFINNMTHELKTPLATIGLAADSIEHPVNRENEVKKSELVAVIKNENNRMISHVDRVLELAKLDGNNLTYDFELKDICELTNRELEQMKLQFEARQGKMNMSSCAECMIHVDSFHFSNVIRNLIDNAIKYSKSAPQIQVTCIGTDSSFELIVEDEGIGMTNQEVKHAFDQFYRGGKLDRSGESGFGLGLSYVKAVITAHEGEVKIVSELGKGTTVSISIPKRNG